MTKEKFKQTLDNFYTQKALIAKEMDNLRKEFLQEHRKFEPSEKVQIDGKTAYIYYSKLYDSGQIFYKLKKVKKDGSISKVDYRNGVFQPEYIIRKLHKDEGKK